MNSEGLKSLGHHGWSRSGIAKISVWSQSRWLWKVSCFSCYSKGLCELVINNLARYGVSYAEWEIDLKEKSRLEC
jgi:hypothetical protein